MIVIKRTGGDIDWSPARDHWYHDLAATVSRDCPPEEMDAEDPLFILYTSGSTGKPKGVLHTGGGYLTYASMTHQYVFDYHDGVFRVFYGLARLIDPPEQGRVTFQLALIKSRDLIHWSEPRTLTPPDDDLNFTDPGNIVRLGDQWIMTVENYRTPFSPSGGPETTRCWLLRSADLEHWSEPEPMLLKGPEVPLEQMGRAICPCLFPDRSIPGKWWCAFKQGGFTVAPARGLAFGGRDLPRRSLLLQSLKPVLQLRLAALDLVHPRRQRGELLHAGGGGRLRAHRLPRQRHRREAVAGFGALASARHLHPGAAPLAVGAGAAQRRPGDRPASRPRGRQVPAGVPRLHAGGQAGQQRPRRRQPGTGVERRPGQLVLAGMSPARVDLATIPGPVLLAGDRETAYRDPLLHYHAGIFRLFCSVVRAQPDRRDRFHVGVTESRDLRAWSPLRAVTDLMTGATSAGRAASSAIRAAGYSV